ncbi:AAA family ATPase [Halobacillus sp. A1]|uniref:ATP-binding protein n=1 Tax=Halobacillus sp. A1 TaxID=2880262 RepID=UPI0020A655D0|nr:AAA family ATPase [Halobacillus sp. A1]MCP3033267.1 AAA family ATPase [Halobacillus sp. A1]
MKINSFHIFAFGKWKNYSLNLGEQKMTIISGNNEAGKSTIQQFLLFILFGLPPKKREFYRPKTGGSIGGRLVVETTEFGEITIERISDRRQSQAICRLADGEEYEEEFLKHLIGGMSKAVYQSIYSFNAEDLSGLHQVTGEELGEVLLNVGLTGSDQIYHTKKTLEKRLDDLFKPKGRNPFLNQELQRLEKLEKKQSDIRQEVGDYRRVVEKIDHLENEIVELELQVNEARSHYYTLVQINKAIPVIQEYHELKVTGEPGSLMSFPDDAGSKMRHLQENLLPLENEQLRIEADLKDKNERFQINQKNEVEFDEKEVRRLISKISTYEQAVHDRNRLKKQLEQNRTEMKHELENLDIPIEEERLYEYEFPFYVEETWRGLREQEQIIVQEEKQLEEENNSLQLQKKQTEQQINDLNEQSISDEEAAANSELIDFYIHSNTNKNSNAPQDRTSAYLFGLIILGGIMISYMTSSFWPIGLAIFISAGMIFFKKESSSKEGLQSMQVSKDDYMHAKQQLQLYEQTKGELAYLSEHLKEIVQKELRLDEQFRTLLNRKERFNHLVNEQYRSYPFLESLKLLHWEKLYHLLKRVKDKQKVIEERSNEIIELDEQIKNIEDDVYKFSEQMKWDDSDQTVSEKLIGIRDFFHSQMNVRENNEQLHREVYLLNKQSERIKQEIAPLFEDKQKLLEASASINVDQFYEKLEAYEQLKYKQKRFNNVRDQINLMLNEKEQRDFKIWSTLPNEAHLKFQLQEKEQEIDYLLKNQKEIQQKKADLHFQMKQLEGSDQLSLLNHQYELNRSQFNEHAKEWAAYKIASEVLERTKEKYQNQYLPRVLLTAQSYFNRLTLGKYVSLSVKRDENRIIVEDYGGFQYSTEELSRGTADQLYVSLRLALAQTLSEELKVPFIVDDAFVNFDEARLSVMLEILSELSRGTQVFLFTWRGDIGNRLDGNRTETFHLPLES